MPLLALGAVFILLPLAELYVILEVVGPWLQWYGTVALLLADSVIGTLLFRSQGRAVWQRFNETMAAGRVPHRELIDGMLVIFGGAFLITPGFLTDIVGLLLLLPPTRSVIRRLVARRLGRRVVVSGGEPYDVDGTASEHDAPARRLER